MSLLSWPTLVIDATSYLRTTCQPPYLFAMLFTNCDLLLSFFRHIMYFKFVFYFYFIFLVFYS